AGLWRHQRNGMGRRFGLRRPDQGFCRARYVMNTEILRRLQAWRAEKRACALVTQVTSGRAALTDGVMIAGDADLFAGRQDAIRARIASDQSGMVEDDLFVRVYVPPPRLVIIGAVHIAQSLAPIARLAGLAVTVIDPREAFI